MLKNMKIGCVNLLCVAMIITISVSSCKTKKDTMIINATDKLEDNNILRTTAPVVVYKTIRDFSEYVPVIMNREKTTIVSYPDRMDITTEHKPTVLTNGYLLDNRGINENVAYLKLTYTAYKNLDKNPSIEALINLIQEKHPLAEMYYCGNQSDYKALIPELNALIDQGFSGCRKADIIPMTMEIKVE